MTRTFRRCSNLVPAMALVVAASTACAPGAAGPSAEPSASERAAPTTGAVAVAESRPITTAAGTTTVTATIPSDWPDRVAKMCTGFIAAWTLHQLPADPTTPLMQHLAAHQAVRAGESVVDPAEVPAAVREGRQGYAAVYAATEAALAEAGRAAAAGDATATEAAMDDYFFELEKTANLFAVAGAPCALADPARAARAGLNVPLELAPLNATAGFGSIWVTEHDGSRVARLDPASGEVQTVVEAPGQPVKLQPSDGRMWGRTGRGPYFAIDPGTNSVTATLARDAVGPMADRAWAVDGGLWICDGRRIHHFDPTTLQRIATIELGIACDMPGGTSDLIVASSYNDDDGQSGTAAAAFIDPATNRLLATVPLPVDVTIGIVLDDSVFFAAEHGTRAVVVDRATWTVRSTPELGTSTGGLGTVEAGVDAIYLPTLDQRDVLVVGTSTFAVTDVIPTLGVQSVTLLDGSLWTAGPGGYLQRFDR